MRRRVWIFAAALALAPATVCAQDIRSPDPWQTPKAGGSGSSRHMDMPSLSLPGEDRDMKSYDVSPPDRSFERPTLEPEPSPEPAPDKSPKR